MKHFLAFIIALFAYTANAQTGSTVTGRVTDDAGNAIERATVTMTRLDDGTKAGACNYRQRRHVHDRQHIRRTLRSRHNVRRL
mgnify:CR=1 FL=1